MKKTYERPEIEIEEFEVEDVITLSAAGDNLDGDYGDISQ